MVKADPVSDYYAELELPPTASVEDIKKQYRKLALTWHPDRNPGNEAEASARFQAIGAAHEILTDPEQRRKYDLSRKVPNSSAPRPNASGRRGNPYATATETQWGPPPRRGDPRYTRAPGAPPPPPPRPANGGAARYKTFDSYSNQAPPPNTSAQESKAHADRLHAAWQATRGGSAPTRKRYNVPPPPSQPPQPQQYARPGAASPEEPNRPSSQEYRPQSQERTSWQRPAASRHESMRAGRSGFDPGSPAADEPPASASAYTSRYNRANHPQMSPSDLPAQGSPNLPPRDAPDLSRRPSATDEPSYQDGQRHQHTPNRSRSGEQVQFAEGGRERTPYSNLNQGERTYFDGDALRRTASMRDATRVAEQAQAANESRRSSFNQQQKTGQTFKPYVVYSSDESDTSGRRSPRRRDSRPEDQSRQHRPPPDSPTVHPPTPHAEPAQPPSNGHPSPGDAMDIDDDPPRTKNSGNGTGLSMNDFRHVHPFSNETSGSGINNMDDLKSGLPFQSGASNSHPLKTPDEPQSSPLDALNPPKLPVPPAAFTKDTWAIYLSRWTAYFTAWNTFNAKVIAHFQDRAIQNQDRERGPSGGMVDGWLGAVGETESLQGWDTYVRCVEEDERVRTRWNIACERHVEAVERHSRARKQVMESGLK